MLTCPVHMLGKTATTLLVIGVMSVVHEVPFLRGVTYTVKHTIKTIPRARVVITYNARDIVLHVDSIA